MRLATSKSAVSRIFAGAFVAALGGGASLAQTDTPNTYQEMAPGLLARTVFKADAGKTAVEIIDLLVGPGQSAEPIVMSGGALLDVQAGSATLVVDGKSQTVQPGAVVSLARDQRVAIDNSRAQRSFVARLVLLSPPDR